MPLDGFGTAPVHTGRGSARRAAVPSQPHGGWAAGVRQRPPHTSPGVTASPPGRWSVEFRPSLCSQRRQVARPDLEGSADHRGRIPSTASSEPCFGPDTCRVSLRRRRRDAPDDRLGSGSVAVNGEGDVKFSILGPVRAWRGEAEMGLGSPQQKAVLVALLLRRGHPATAGELIDALWGEDSPPGAVSVLRTYASRLRKILEPDRTPGQSPGLVVSIGDGYALRVAQTALDLGVFEQRMARAKQLRAAGELPEAGELLHIALDAWSGTPLAGIPGPLAEAERSRLAERRLNALETRIEVDLQMGHHAELVPELKGLCGDHPLRERLCELLMLSLYRCGRQAEALDAYRATRRKLVDELGVEPGPALRETHMRLLAADPVLAAAGPAADLVTSAGPGHGGGGGEGSAAGPRAADEATAGAGVDPGAGPGTAAAVDGGRTGRPEEARAGAPVPGTAVADPDAADGDLGKAGPGGGTSSVAGGWAAAVAADPAENMTPAGDHGGTGEDKSTAGHADRAVSGAAPAAGPAFAPLPSQLPADLPAFTGRLAELNRTRALLPDGEYPSTVIISAIGGMAGIGKTTLAVHWAHQIAPPLPRRPALRQPPRLRSRRRGHGPRPRRSAPSSTPSASRRSGFPPAWRPRPRSTAACWPAGGC